MSVNNWNNILSNTRNLNDVLVIVRKILAMMGDLSTLDASEILENINSIIDSSVNGFDEKQLIAINDFKRLMEELAATNAGENGWLAEFIAYGDITQKEFNENQEKINLKQIEEVNTLGSYIVYAEKYGNSLNEAMDAINLEFTGKRVRVYVPSDFPVTATVNLNIDCDLDMKSLQVKNDVDTIFEPKVGWNGSANQCGIFCNHHSIRLGWNLKKSLGYISIDQHTFFDVGNELIKSSALYFFAFYLSVVDIKKLDLYNPSTINSYVKPNSVIGDNTGSNRNIVMEGIFTENSFASDINIHNHTAKNLLPNEDSDSLVVNISQQSLISSKFNIDIYGGYAENVQKRMYKFMLFKKATGIRLHGDSIAIGGGSKPYIALDLYGDGILEAEGSIRGENWITGIANSGSVQMRGNYSAYFTMDNVSVDGNQCRALLLNGNNGLIELDRLEGVGGAELYQCTSSNSLKINKLAKHTTWLRTASNAGNVFIENLEILLADSPVPVVREEFLFSVLSNNGTTINRVTMDSTASTKNDYLFRALAGISNFTINKVRINSGISVAILRAVNAVNIRIRDAKAPTLPYLIRIENGGKQFLFDQCVTPTSGNLYYDIGNLATEVVELNTLRF